MLKLIAGLKAAYSHFGALFVACGLAILAVLCVGIWKESSGLIVVALLGGVIFVRLIWDGHDMPAHDPTEFSTYWSEHEAMEMQRQAILKRARAWDAQAMAVRSSVLGGHAGGEL